MTFEALSRGQVIFSRLLFEYDASVFLRVWHAIVWGPLSYKATMFCTVDAGEDMGGSGSPSSAGNRFTMRLYYSQYKTRNIKYLVDWSVLV